MSREVDFMDAWYGANAAFVNGLDEGSGIGCEGNAAGSAVAERALVIRHMSCTAPNRGMSGDRRWEVTCDVSLFH
ncbi:hypothetical protein GALLR39Z86_34310 [Glycomyces algeriensis]|uniref:Uncharacterized protein n=1 Tax=Glycomyces algeriensis TaxID=256037 RepID=A0A9W6GAP2_9ACTN|nr:hypothetical protein GALLR39Z86_34310 [Glycomyces algeriensis]